jgi:hypothetical protein
LKKNFPRKKGKTKAAEKNTAGFLADHRLCFYEINVVLLLL